MQKFKKMNSILITGISLVQAALITYTATFIIAYRKKNISKLFLNTLSIAVLFDITATIFMIAGSAKGFLTIHGLIGYTSLGMMLVKTVQFYLFTKKNGYTHAFSKKQLAIFTFIYIYWVLAYITGAVLILFRY